MENTSFPIGPLIVTNPLNAPYDELNGLDVCTLLKSVVPNLGPGTPAPQSRTFCIYLLYWEGAPGPGLGIAGLNVI